MTETVRRTILRSIEVLLLKKNIEMLWNTELTTAKKQEAEQGFQNSIDWIEGRYDDVINRFNNR